MDFNELKDKISRTDKLLGIKPGTKSYNTLCFNLLSYININHGIETCYVNEAYFEGTLISSKEKSHSTLNDDKEITGHCAFILKYQSTNLVFSFGHQDKKNLQKLSDHICKIDNNDYKSIHIIIFKNEQELHEARKLKNANVYKRGFFTSFDKICTEVLEIDEVKDEKTFSTGLKYIKGTDKPKNKKILPDTVNLYTSVIVDNVPVGEESSKLYKLTFITEDTIDILPGQFMMIDTLRERQNEILKSYRPRIIGTISNVTPNIYNDLGTKQISYLKRPFGIYRAYYENFDNDYLSKLNLEKTLASILYTVKPNKFEILYKILEGGVGTNELTKIAKEDKIEILAPLGSIFDLRELLKEDFDEIHIVGGGVGMAPLVYLVQALRYFNCKVKVFIGIEKYSSLAYNDLNANSFTSTGSNAKIYVDDLKMLGLSENSDIYVSIESNTDAGQITDIKNVFMGTMVTGPYEEYLKLHSKLKAITFTCGPLPMMHKVHDITSRYNIKSYVLMEKRMACGIGVCFSCVCQTTVNGENHNSRVCIDGPIIESKLINWNE